MSPTGYEFHVGIDWGTQEHRVMVLDADRRPLHDRRVAQDGATLEGFATWLSELVGGRVEVVAIALETPRGAIVDTLVARGFHVFALNPKQLDRFRDRYTVAGAKDDRRDARVLADALATDRAAFRRLAPEDPRLIELRELSRLDDLLGIELRRLSNRLREQLSRFSPQLLGLCPAADEPWFWALLDRAPTPSAARTLPRATVRHLLARFHIRRLTADDIVPLLRTPALPVAAGTVTAAAAHLAVLLPQLQLLHAQRGRCAARSEALLAELADTQEHRDVSILRSLPGVGRSVAATMLAEASRLLAARDYHALRACSGVAPVTKQSGKRLLVMMRYACNPRLRNALHYWGQTAVRYDPRCQAQYAQLRARGHSHGRALRGVLDRLLRVLMAMLTTQTAYDPARRAIPAAEIPA
jgi:transposase